MSLVRILRTDNYNGECVPDEILSTPDLPEEDAKIIVDLLNKRTQYSNDFYRVIRPGEEYQAVDPSNGATYLQPFGLPRSIETSEIEFSRNYSKLHNQKSAVLLAVTSVDSDTISEEFIKYDTDGEFDIGHGIYLKLTFIGDLGIPFTTLRKYNIENVRKYDRKQGQKFIIKVKTNDQK